jgi:hypothetical protein
MAGYDQVTLERGDASRLTTTTSHVMNTCAFIVTYPILTAVSQLCAGATLMCVNGRVKRDDAEYLVHQADLRAISCMI